MFNTEKIKNSTCFFIQGEDTFISDYYIEKISDYFSINKNERKTFFLRVDSEASLLSEISNYDLFSSKKLIVVYSISRLSTKSRKEIFELQKNNPEDVYIVAIEYDSTKNTSIVKQLKKDWIAFDSRIPFPRDMKKWIRLLCDERQINIKSNEIDNFIDLHGNNISEVMDEINKAAIYSKSQDISKYLNLMSKESKMSNYAIWQLIDAIGNKDKKKSIIIGTSLISKRISIQRITYSLFNFFITMEQTKNGANKTMGRFYLNRFLSNNLPKYTSKFSDKQRSDIFFSLRKMDYMSKNTSIKDIVLLEEFIINACSS